VHAAAVHFDLHLPQAHSLKEKRAILRPILEGCRHRYQVAAAEVDHQDAWQRAGLGVSTVSGSAGQVSQVLDQVERFVWSFPEIEVIGAVRRWMEEE
jgi:uncharacterized protein YlxP (DUF503 family)